MQTVEMTWLLQGKKEDIDRMKGRLASIYNQMSAVLEEYGEIRGGEHRSYHYNPKQQVFVQPEPRVHLAAATVIECKHYESPAICGPRPSRRVQQDPAKVTCRLCLKMMSEQASE
jgi:hypothetical protein